jgi:SAM-dependent methyltransferase
MDKRDIDSKSEKELQELIIKGKKSGISDAELGQKYGVNYKYIENIITKTQGLNISNLTVSKKVKSLQPKFFQEEQTSVWSFRQRGNWATHSGEYRGNWSPYIPRNIILKYSDPGDLVLDYFCGSGTTAVECKLMGRKCIALDINDQAIELTKTNLNFSVDKQGSLFGRETSGHIYEPQVMVGDARDLSVLPENSIDLICAHPPYANIIHYTESNVNDLSSLGFDDFLAEMAKVAKESFRVLKPGKKCAIWIGDSRNQKHVNPLGF